MLVRVKSVYTYVYLVAVQRTGEYRSSRPPLLELIAVTSSAFRNYTQSQPSHYIHQHITAIIGPVITEVALGCVVCAARTFSDW